MSTEWFVYSDTRYYPFAEVITADTAEEALAKLRPAELADGACAFPMSALAAATTPDLIASLRDEAQYR